mmetsp:Transcript_63218/g.112384  ORF Transcript_63218/g.112384 Transcript_63218/m.112384 type:complete len:153 (-) Transcript_63218:17-475(-)
MKARSPATSQRKPPKTSRRNKVSTILKRDKTAGAVKIDVDDTDRWRGKTFEGTSELAVQRKKLKPHKARPEVLPANHRVPGTISEPAPGSPKAAPKRRSSRQLISQLKEQRQAKQRQKGATLLGPGPEHAEGSKVAPPEVLGMPSMKEVIQD